MKILRQIKANLHGVPFCVRVCVIHTREADANGIIFFDDKDCYIKLPRIGDLVTYRYEQQVYQYRVVAYQNENPHRGLLNDTEYINLIIEFVRKL